MSPDPHAMHLDEEIAEIENRRGTRRTFLVLGAAFGLILLLVVIYGVRERARLRAEEARPRTAELALGQHLGTTSNTAVFSDGQRLSYVEGVGDVTVEDATFARHLEYDQEGNPIELPSGITHWSLVESDSLPYVVEPVTNPLTGVNPADYRSLNLGAIEASDYGTGGPADWRPLELEETNVSVTGQAQLEDGSVYLAADDARVRLQGIEGLGGLDSLEMAWATSNGTPISAFGRITSTPGGGDPLFVMIVNAVDPPRPTEAGSEGAGATAPDTAPPAP
ncbi:MAG: hypothetical protein ACREMD_11045 [Gemmatimonadota bacterium]